MTFRMLIRHSSSQEGGSYNRLAPRKTPARWNRIGIDQAEFRVGTKKRASLSVARLDWYRNQPRQRNRWQVLWLRSVHAILLLLCSAHPFVFLCTFAVSISSMQWNVTAFCPLIFIQVQLRIMNSEWVLSTIARDSKGSEVTRRDIAANRIHL